MLRPGCTPSPSVAAAPGDDRAVAALPVASAAVSPKRDLTGFAPPGGMPPPPPLPVAAPGTAPKREERSEDAPREPAARGGRSTRASGTSARRGGGRPGRRRICVSLTLEASEQLAALAQARHSWKVEVILESLARWDDHLRSDEPGGERTRFRRRRSSTPTPFVMDLTPEELQRLDDLAKALGSSRSALVRQLILLEASASSANGAADGTRPPPPPGHGAERYQ